jgi:hypothetical protein
LTSEFWHDWIGLPWSLGADPRQGKAACCFATAQAVREVLGMPWPARQMKQWYSRARARDWLGLQRDWEQMTALIETPEAGALVQFRNADGSFGVGVLPNAETLITVRHYGRLIAGPLAACENLKLHRLR